MVFGLYLDKTQLDLKLQKQMFVSHLFLLCCHKWFLPLWLFLSHLIDQLKILYWCPSPDHTRTLKKKKSVKFDYGTWSKGNSIRSLEIKLIIWRPLTVDILESQMWVEVSEFTIKDPNLYPIQVLRSLTCGTEDPYRVKVRVLYNWEPSIKIDNSASTQRIRVNLLF